MTKLIVTFGNCAKAPKNLNSCQDGKGAKFHIPEQECQPSSRKTSEPTGKIERGTE